MGHIMAERNKQGRAIYKTIGRALRAVESGDVKSMAEISDTLVEQIGSFEMGELSQARYNEIESTASHWVMILQFRSEGLIPPFFE